MITNYNYYLAGTFHVKKPLPIKDKVFDSILKFNQANYLNERFHRPSKQTEKENPYTFSFIKNNKNILFLRSPDVIYAYFALIKEAANMYGYSCGCGSIGNAKEPYEYAYQLFTPEYKTNHSFDEFINSYSGTGHTTFLNLYDAYTPFDTPKNIKYYVFEYEIISGTKQSVSNLDAKTYCNFNYMYGIITTEYYNEQGWKIKSMDTLQEDFLCAPYHKWSYLSNLVIQYVYIEGLGIIEQVTNKYISGNHIHIYATGNNQDYRIDFVRLTNGYDLLLHEYIWMNNNWVETNLLSPEWKSLKFSIESFEM